MYRISFRAYLFIKLDRVKGFLTGWHLLGDCLWFLLSYYYYIYSSWFHIIIIYDSWFHITIYSFWFHIVIIIYVISGFISLYMVSGFLLLVYMVSCSGVLSNEWNCLGELVSGFCSRVNRCQHDLIMGFSFFSVFKSCSELPPDFDMNSCDENMYTCESKQMCVLNSLRCNDVANCNDGSDELNCRWAGYGVGRVHYAYSAASGKLSTRNLQ